MLAARRVHPRTSFKDVGTKSAPQQLVELLIRARDLHAEKRAVNALCVLFRRQFGQWKEFAATEVISNNASPMFCESFALEYSADSPDERLRFEVQQSEPGKHERCVIGRAEAQLSELIDASGHILTSSLSLLADGFARPRGYLSVTCEFVRPTKGKAMVHVGASKIKKKSFLSKDKPHTFLEIARSIDAVEFHPVYRTAVCWKSSDPRWPPFEVSLEKLCNSDKSRKFLFRVSHAGKSGSYLIGEVEMTLEKLHDTMASKMRRLVLRKSAVRTDKSSSKERGVLKLHGFEVDYHYTFMDYFCGGCRLKLIVGVDFTLSNGSLDMPRSLHHQEEGIYRAAFEGVLHSFIPYLTTSEITAFGFGAKMPGSAETNHCFPIGEDRAMRTFEDFLEEYAITASKVTFSGPTYGCPLLRKVEKLLGKEMPDQNNQFYNFLIIFTDGVLNDLEDFKKYVKSLHAQPLSVLVIGVGPMDLSSMEYFDRSSSEASAPLCDKAQRWNSHFFHLMTPSEPEKKLVSELFAVVSSQMVAFMKSCGIVASAPVLRASGGLARGARSRELRDSFRRRDSAKLCSAAAKRQRLHCPTCGQLVEAEDGPAVAL